MHTFIGTQTWTVLFPIIAVGMIVSKFSGPGLPGPCLIPDLLDLVHSVRITPAEHPESLEPGEVYRSSLDAPLSEMGDGLQWGRFSKAKPHFRTAEALIERDWRGGASSGLGWNMLEHVGT